MLFYLLNNVVSENHSVHFFFHFELKKTSFYILLVSLLLAFLSGILHIPKLILCLIIIIVFKSKNFTPSEEICS